MDFQDLAKAYRGRRVLVTGHTGFKGAWLCKVLAMAGADVYGYALVPPTEPNAFEVMGIASVVHSEIGDIRDFEHLKKYFEQVKPEFVFHLAAQPIVRESYKYPKETFEINVMGTVNVLECIRTVPGVKSFLNVTTDKVYENYDMYEHAFTEDEKLDGFDPYSNSKSCSELVTHSYYKSFFCGKNQVPVSTARAGNVIGGGDFALDRIIPDCVRATVKHEKIIVRNPYSTRPYQHVLEPLFAYLLIASRQVEDPSLAGWYNVGPDEEDCINTGTLADMFVREWGSDASWINVSETDALHESNFLKLDCKKLKTVFGWKPRWHVNEAVAMAVNWYYEWISGSDMQKVTEEQILKFARIL